MNRNVPKTTLSSLASLIAAYCIAGSSSFASTPDLPLLKAKQEAEGGGYVFLTTREEIVAGAKKEGGLRLLGSLSPETYKILTAAFKKHYPFIEVYAEEFKSTDAHQPFLLELRAGRARNWDVFVIAPDFYAEYVPHTKRFDLLGMAMRGVLAIPPAMIDPKNRTIVSIASSIFGIAYNKKLIAEEKLPKNWEEFVKPELKGKKFMVDLRPLGFAALAAGLGEAWAADYARKIAAQDPVWFRGQSRSFATLVAGEQTLLHLAYYHSCMRASKKDPSGSLECKVIEPVPARIAEFAAVSHYAPHPNTSLLWLEFEASPEAQNIIDIYEPLNSSIYAPGSALAKLTQGKKLSVNGWETLHNTSKWEQMAIKEFGFPKVEETGK
jgi:iron(III) transport system substrate-binding protein